MPARLQLFLPLVLCAVGLTAVMAACSDAGNAAAAVHREGVPVGGESVWAVDLVRTLPGRQEESSPEFTAVPPARPSPELRAFDRSGVLLRPVVDSPRR